MIALSNTAILEKNYIFSKEVWIPLLTLSNKSKSVVYRICPHTTNITFNGNTFYYFPCKVEDFTESKDGSIPSTTIKVSNVERIIGGWIDQDPDLGVAWDIQVEMILTSTYESGIAEYTYDFVSTSASVNDEEVTLTCGIRNPMRVAFPPHRMFTDTCPHRFKGVVCGYSGTDTSCGKTLADCREKFSGGTIPFGGFPAISSSGFYQ
jgi:phage-related protein